MSKRTQTCTLARLNLKPEGSPKDPSAIVSVCMQT